MGDISYAVAVAITQTRFRRLTENKHINTLLVSNTATWIRGGAATMADILRRQQRQPWNAICGIKERKTVDNVIIVKSTIRWFKASFSHLCSHSESELLPIHATKAIFLRCEVSFMARLWQQWNCFSVKLIWYEKKNRNNFNYKFRLCSHVQSIYYNKIDGSFFDDIFDVDVV